MAESDTKIDWAEGLGNEDAIAIGSKIVEMAEKLKFAPGAQAKWSFEMDNDRFDVIVTEAPKQ